MTEFNSRQVRKTASPGKVHVWNFKLTIVLHRPLRTPQQRSVLALVRLAKLPTHGP